MECYTPEEREIIVSIFLANKRSAMLARREFQRRFPSRVAPTSATFRNLAARIEPTENTKDFAKTSPQRTTRSAENTEADNNEASITRRATQLRFTRRTKIDQLVS